MTGPLTPALAQVEVRSGDAGHVAEAQGQVDLRPRGVDGHRRGAATRPGNGRNFLRRAQDRGQTRRGSAVGDHSPVGGHSAVRAGVGKRLLVVGAGRRQKDANRLFRLARSMAPSMRLARKHPDGATSRGPCVTGGLRRDQGSVEAGEIARLGERYRRIRSVSPCS
jgi:hypothetical protein